MFKMGDIVKPRLKGFENLGKGKVYTVVPRDNYVGVRFENYFYNSGDCHTFYMKDIIKISPAKKRNLPAWW